MNVDFRHCYETPPDRCLINDPEFPLDVFNYIFSYLSRSGMSINLVCRDWNNRIISVEKDKLCVLSRFMESCKEWFIPKLADVVIAIPEMDLVNMVKFRHSAGEIKQEMLNGLLKLKDEDLVSLEEKTKNQIHNTFLENIFEVVRINKKLEGKLEVRRTFCYEIKDIVVELAAEHETDKALAVAHIFKTSVFSPLIANAVAPICSILVKDGDLIRALKTVDDFFKVGSSDWAEAMKSIRSALEAINNQSKAMQVTCNQSIL